MLLRPLGNTGLRVSAVSFGCGPVSGLMTGEDRGRRLETVRAALDAGVNWFDTAATYGGGSSETNLGDALRTLDAVDRAHVATKVRLMPEDLDDIAAAVRRSFAESLRRLGLPRVTLLQLHNSLTRRRGDLHTSIAPDDVLRPGGVLETFEALRDEGLVEHLGLTGLGDADSLREAIDSGRFATLQIEHNLLNPSAGRAVPREFAENDYGHLFADCRRHGMGAFAIRVYAGGALAGQQPSAHTLTTKFFPLDLYRRDQQRTEELRERLPAAMPIREAAVRFVLSDPRVTSALIGFGSPAEVEEAARHAAAGPLPEEVLRKCGPR